MANNPRANSTNEEASKSRTSLFSSKLIITDAVIAALVIGSYLAYRSQPKDYGFGLRFWVIISLVITGIAVTSFRMVEISRLRRRLADSRGHNAPSSGPGNTSSSRNAK
jgi:hypothetical protein